MLLQNLRFAARTIARRPAFLLVAAASLSLGTGVNSTIFSLLDGLALRPLGVPRTSEIVRLFSTTDQQLYGTLSYPEYEELRRGMPSLTGLAACMGRGGALYHGDSRRDVMVNVVSPDFFQVMEVRAHRGRLFGPEPVAEPAVVIAYSAWHRLFGGDPAVVGKTVRLSQASVTIAGILPPEFRDLGPTGDREFWMPRETWLAIQLGSKREFTNRQERLFDVIGRVRSDVSLATVRAEAASIATRMERDHPAENRLRRATALSDFQYRLKRWGPMILAVLALVVLVLVIACVNVANLLLARATARRGEMAMRTALGASRRHLLSLLMTENALLGLLGMALGLILAAWLIESLPALIVWPQEFRHFFWFRFDARVVGFTAGVSLLALLAFGLAPSLVGSRVNVMSVLKGDSGETFRRWPVRSILAITQVCLSVILLSMAGVLIQSFRNILRADLGFSRNKTEVVWIIGDARLYREAVNRIRTLAGVADLGVGVRAPLSFSGGGRFLRAIIPGHPAFRDKPPAEIKYNAVDDGYFRVMGTKLLRGRLFDTRDAAGAPNVVVISEATAQRYWPGEDPVGRFIRTGERQARDWQIVGVVQDARINSVVETPEPYLYVPFWQMDFGEITLIALPKNDTVELAPAIRSTLKSLHSSLEPRSIYPMNDLIRYATALQQMFSELIGALALLAIALTAVGVYGVVSYTVLHRTREIGIRMALGATWQDSIMLALRSGVSVAIAGVLFGVPLSLATIYAIRSSLYGMGPVHVPSVVMAAVAVVVITLLASLVPARRAARVDPMLAIRAE